MTFSGWVRFELQEPQLAAIDRAPEIPWHTWLRYLAAAISMYYLPTAMRYLDRYNGHVDIPTRD